ncbi:MAG TPA: mechanosensitive ion channel domain-containing protein [Gammaproteobacteria bacterium]
MIRELITQYSGKTLLALAVLLASTFLGWLLSLLIRRLGKHKTMQRSRVYRLIANSLNTVIVGAGVISALGTLGVNVAALVAGLGLTGFALGLALKDAISNFVAGMMIVVYSPFGLEDTIELSGVKGRVVDINLRYVTLQTETEVVLIPNSNFLTSAIRKSVKDSSSL